MSWITVIWSMIASACLTLGAVYFVVWWRNRTAKAHLLFAVTAVSTTAFAFCELWLMRVQTPAELIAALRWGHIAMLFWLVSLVWFVTFHLGTGRRWLAWTITGMRAFYLLFGLLVWQSVNYLEITSLGHIPFLGEPVTIFKGIPNPWNLFGYAAMLLILIFVADASITAWRRGDRRRAVMVGGAVEFFLLLGILEPALVFWANLPLPILISPLYLGLVAVMGYDLSRDVLRASQLVHELQASEAGLRESEARMSLAVDAADLGIWTRDVARTEISASDKWRELFEFSPLEQLEFSAFLERLHPDDRERLQRTITQAIAGANQSKYKTEYRLMRSDGAMRWIASQGRVERDGAGRPILIRGTALDITDHKLAEFAVRNLSGRLLRAQEEERRVVARELHDNLSQQVALLAIEIESVAMRPEHQVAVKASLGQLGARTAEISTELHNLSHRLHSTKLETLGLQAAVLGHCRERRVEGLHVHCVAENVPAALAHDVALCVFRIVQEGLNNIVKHSGAREARVTLTGATGGLLLTIADSGRGFDAAAAANGGLGLASMRERVYLVGGDLALESRPGHGTTIIVRVPIGEAGQAAPGPPTPRIGYDTAPISDLVAPRSVADGDSPNTALYALAKRPSSRNP